MPGSGKKKRDAKLGGGVNQTKLRGKSRPMGLGKNPARGKRKVMQGKGATKATTVFHQHNPPKRRRKGRSSELPMTAVGKASNGLQGPAKRGQRGKFQRKADDKKRGEKKKTGGEGKRRNVYERWTMGPRF